MMIVRFEKIHYENVNPDGTFKNERGAIETKGVVLFGIGKGCGSPGCHCSDGYWISIVLPRTDDGVVEGTIVKFDSKSEMLQMMEQSRFKLSK